MSSNTSARGAGRRPAAAPEREHRRLLAGVVAALRELTRQDVASTPTTTRRSPRPRAASASAPINVVLTNGLDEASCWHRWWRCAERRPTIAVRGDRRRPGVRHVRRVHRRRRRRVIEVPLGAGLRFPAAAGARRRSARRTRIVCLTNPNNPTGLSIPRSAIAAHRRGGAAGARLRRRGLRRLRRADADRRRGARAGFRTSSSAGRSPRPTGWPDCASARWSAPRRRWRRFAGPCRPTRSTSAPPRRCRRRSTTARTTTGTSSKCASRSGCSTTRSSGSASRFWPSDGNFVLARFGDDLARVVAGLAGARHPRPRSVARSRLRRLRADHRRRRRSHARGWSRRSRRSCAARA